MGEPFHCLLLAALSGAGTWQAIRYLYFRIRKQCECCQHDCK